MDKGIRPFCNNKFVELNEQRRRGLLTNTQFRKNVMASCMEEFGITLASAATHYNHAFKTVKELNAELVSGLGRPEDKKGGRKPKAKATEATPALVATLLSTGIKENTSTHTVTINPPAAPTLFTVRKKSDGTVVAEGLTRGAADALVAKAKAAKKATLEVA